MVEVLITHYGPVAFGAVILLIVWQVIVKPILQQNKIDTKAIETVSNTLRETAGILDNTVKNLGRIVDRLENMEERFERETAKN